MMEIENKTVHTPREKGKKISTQPAGRRLTDYAIVFGETG